MGKSVFVKDNQMEEWVEAALRIKKEYGIKKALSYLIGEKFYNVIEMIYASRKIMRVIEEQREKPDNDLLRKGKGGHRINLDEDYENEKNKIPKVLETLTEFSGLIKNSFSQHEIKAYFDSHPRLGVFGSVCTEEEYESLAEHDAIEHSIDTEVKDAMIFGDMTKYLMN